MWKNRVLSLSSASPCPSPHPCSHLARGLNMHAASGQCCHRHRPDNQLNQSPFCLRLTTLYTSSTIRWRRKRHPTPVFLPGESQDGGAWWAAIYGVAQSWTRLKQLSSSSSSNSICRKEILHGHLFPVLINYSPKYNLHKGRYSSFALNPSIFSVLSFT